MHRCNTTDHLSIKKPGLLLYSLIYAQNGESNLFCLCPKVMPSSSPSTHVHARNPVVATASLLWPPTASLGLGSKSREVTPGHHLNQQTSPFRSGDLFLSHLDLSLLSSRMLCAKPASKSSLLRAYCIHTLVWLRVACFERDRYWNGSVPLPLTRRLTGRLASTLPAW